MVVRFALTILVLILGFIGTSRSQENAPPATTSASSSEEVPSKGLTPSTPRSPARKKASSLSQSPGKPKSERATFGAGCFWHVEEVFEHTRGVNSAVSGYAGGAVPYPSYEMVHEGNTGHAEVVMVDFNPEIITYDELLKIFWKNHDPTSINRQGPDEGPQYRSVIFYHNEEQRLAALKSYRALTDLGVYRAPIVTQLMPMKAFYRAEDYHQDYYGGKPRASSRRRKTTVSKARKTPSKGAQATAPTKVTEADSSDTSPSSTP